MAQLVTRYVIILITVMHLEQRFKSSFELIRNSQSFLTPFVQSVDNLVWINADCAAGSQEVNVLFIIVRVFLPDSISSQK
jgi:hypothetical protein